MSSTLQIQQQLNNLLDDANKLVEKLSNQYKDQVDLLGKILDATKTLGDALSNMSKGGSDLSASFENAASAAEKAKTSVTDAMSEASRETNNASDSARRLDQSIKDTDKSMREMEGGIGIIGGIGKALSFAASGGVSFLSMLGSISSALFSVASAVITFPFKILDGLINMASQGGSSELAQALNEIRKEFGYLNKTAGYAIVSLSKSMKGELANTGLSVYRTFGNLAERLKYFTEYAKNLGETVDAVFSTLKAGSAEALGAFNKALGFTAAGQKGVAQRALATGQDLNEVNRQIANYSIQLSDAFGVTMKLVSRDVGEMMADVEHFGSLSVREMTQSAVFARKLGIEVKALGKLVDKFLNFEDAANSAAQLSQAFGMNVDAFKLMQEQDPGKKLQMLRDGFFATGRTVENMTAQERRLLATQSGLSESELQLAFSQKSRSLTYDQIKKKGDAAQKSQLTQAQALEKLSGAIERLVKSGSAMQGGFFDRFIQGFVAGIQRTTEFRQLMRALSRSLYIVYRAGIDVGRMFVDLFPGVRDFFVGLKEVFNPRDMQNFMNRVKSIFREFFQLLTTNPSTALPILLEKLQAAFADRITAAGPGGRRVLDGIKAFFTAIVVIASSLLKKAMEGVTMGLKYILDLLTGRASLGALPSDGGFFATALAPLIDAVTQAWPPLWEAFKNLFNFLFQKIKAYVMEVLPPLLMTALKYAIIAAAAVALTQAVVGGIASAIGGMLKMLATAITGGGAGGPAAGMADKAKSLVEFINAFGKVDMNAVLKMGGTMFAIAVALGLGGVAMAAAILAIAYILSNAEPKFINAALGVMAVTALGSVALVAAFQLLSKANPEEVIKGGVLALKAMGALAAATFLLVLAFSLFDPNRLVATAKMMLIMTGVVMGIGVLIAEAALIGLLVTGPQLAAVGAGFIAIGAALAALTVAVVGIIISLNQLDLRPGFEAKINAFVKVFEAVSGFLKNFSAILDAIKPGIFQTIFSRGNPMKDNIDAVKNLMQQIVGQPGGGGMIGMVETIVRALTNLTDDQIKRASGLTTVLDSVGRFILVLTKSILALSLATELLGGKLSDTIGQAIRFFGSFVPLIDGLLSKIGDFITRISSITLDDNARKNGEIFANMLKITAEIVSTLITPLKVFENLRNLNVLSVVTIIGSLSAFISTISSRLAILFIDLQDLVRGLASAIARFNFSEQQVKFLAAVGTIISSLVSVISSLSGVITETVRNRRTENLAPAFAVINQTMQNLLQGIGPSLRDILSSVFEAIRGLRFAPGEMAQVSAKARVLKDLFAVIGSVSEIINSFGSSGQPVHGGIVWDKMRMLGDALKWLLDPQNEVGNNVQVGLTRLGALTISDSIRPNALKLKSMLDVVKTVQQSIASIDSGGGLEAKKTAMGQLNNFLNSTELTSFIDSMGNQSTITDARLENLRSTSVAVAEMVASINTTSRHLSSIEPISIQAGLSRLAANLGLGGNAAYTIQNRNFTITVNVDVHMDTKELENTLINRKGTRIQHTKA